MQKQPKRVIYLASTEDGRELLEWLNEQNCTVVLANTENEKYTAYPPYDLGLSFLYEHRVPASEFAAPYKWVNFHSGPLPEFRGRNLGYYAIMKKASTFGATIHYMDADFDTGEIIEVVRFPVEPQHTAGDLVDMSRGELVRLFKKYVPRLLRGRVQSRPQEAGTYYRRTKINPYIELTAEQSLEVRALSVARRYYPTVSAGGREYAIVPVEELASRNRKQPAVDEGARS